MTREKFIFAVDLGGTNLKSAFLNNKFKIINKEVVPTPHSSSKKDLLDALSASFTKLAKAAGVRKDMVLGAGIGVPGPVDFSTGVVHCFPNIRGWIKVPFRLLLRRQLKVPVFIDNDANLMCLAESRIGSARGAQNVVAITLGTGVGGAVIIGRRLYRGSNFLAGEIGHVPLNLKGPKCSCGGQACLERYVGNRAIKELAQKEMGRDLSLDELSLLSSRGNKKAVKVWRMIGEYLGVALSGVVNILNPDIIVIGGGVSGAGKVLFSSISATVLKRAMPSSSRALRIVKAELGNDAGLKGAAILVNENLSGI